MAVLTRFARPNDPNRFDTLAIQSLLTAITFAAAVEIPKPVRKAIQHYIDVANLTGAITINATNIVAGTDFDEGDIVYLTGTADVTGRTITWGTNFRAAVAATLVVPSNGTWLAKCVYINSKLHVLSQSAL